ncbi:MAG: EamA family transporter, partial [Eubacteriales bacterium]|nr:EamA family transporter [Eubacteriales bacterium]
MWLFYAILSAFFAGATSILAKVGIQNINSNLATAIRTTVILVLAWGIAFASGSVSGISSISKKSMLFLILSGLATGASWIYYFKALSMANASKVVPIDKLSIVFSIVLAFFILKEAISIKAFIGIILNCIGILMT